VGNRWDERLNDGVRYSQAVREHANKMRARRPRPYLDKYKQAVNSPECPVGVNCQGRGKTGGSPARRNPFVEKNEF
jgi:hypothetical protein